MRISGRLSAGRFPAFALSVCLLLAVFVTACGGDSFEPVDFDFDDFEEEEADSGPPPTPDPFARLTDDDLRSIRLRYLHDLSAMIDEMEADRRSAVRLLEEAGGEPVDLDWVINFHEVHRASEEFRIRAYGYPLPEEIAEDYISFHAAFLETVQMYSFATDRLLSAAILLGPTGRLSSDMLPAEHSQYMSLVSESLYYYLDTEMLVTRAEEDLKLLLKDLRLR